MQPDEHLEIRYAAAVQAAESEDQSADDRPRARQITAHLTTYGQTLTPQSSWGMPVRMLAGALQAPPGLNAVKLLRDHDESRVIGAMTEFKASKTGPKGVFRLARTAAADEAFVLAEDGILDSVSVGYGVQDYRIVTEDEREVLEVSRAMLREVSLVGRPADPTALIDSVSARKARPVNALPAQAAEPAPAPAPSLSTEQLDQVLAHLRDNMAPPAAAPVTPPPVVSARIVDADGNPIVLAAADRRDPRIATVTGRDGRPYTAGDFFSTYARGVQQGDWTPHQTIRAALADEITTDIPGMLPQAIVGELLGRASGRRPVWDSFAARDMPMSGAKFSRPKITQHVTVGPRGTEKTAPPSQKFKVALEEVAKKTFAGGLDVSNEALDWSSPSLLNELIVDFTRIYAAYTDQYASTELVAAATAGAQSVAWDGTAPKLIKALADAAVLVAQGVDPTVDAFPNTIWISLDVWALIAGLTDTTSRPLLPNVGPMNAFGGINITDPTAGPTQTGFQWVVSRNLPAQTMIMGDREYVERYENGRRLLQAQNVPALGLDIAYMGYGAVYAPYTKTLVKITLPAPPPPAP